MVAGTKYRGQFEELKALMAEVENDKSIILLSMKFILLLVPVGQVIS
jgi:ATP-dependent Clp protease ATP-binding subunit ClpA